MRSVRIYHLLLFALISAIVFVSSPVAAVNAHQDQSKSPYNIQDDFPEINRSLALSAHEDLPKEDNKSESIIESFLRQPYTGKLILLTVLIPFWLWIRKKNKKLDEAVNRIDVIRKDFEQKYEIRAGKKVVCFFAALLSALILLFVFAKARIDQVELIIFAITASYFVTYFGLRKYFLVQKRKSDNR